MKLICCLFLLLSFVARAEILEAVSHPWCPYVCEPEKSQGQEGYFVDALKTAMAKHKIKVHFTIIPYTRALKDTTEGKVDAIVGVNTEGKPGLLFSTPLGKTQSCFFTRSSTHWTYQGAKSLDGIRFGIVQAYNYGAEIMAYIESHKENKEAIQILPSTTNLEQNVKKVLTNRIDTFVDDRSVVDWYLRQNKLKNKLKLAGCIKERDLVIGFSGNNSYRSKKFLQILDEEITKMKASGELEQIIGNYR